MSRILVVYYSQTGQLTNIVRSMLAPLAGRRDVTIDWAEIKPRKPFPFPWGFLEFFDAFPESVYLDPPEVNTAGFNPDDDYDLIVLAYQVWFLSPSLPVTGFIRSPEGRVLRGRQVITVVGCRNMWVTAHRAMQGLLRDAGAAQIDNVVFIDDAPLWTTFVTTPWWLLTGNKGPMLGGLLPEAGIDAGTIAGASRFGRALVDALPAIARRERGPWLAGLKAVTVSRTMLLGERAAHRGFRIWGRLIRKAGRPGAVARKPILVIYVCFLIMMILFVLPITATLSAIIARLSRRLDGEVQALEAPSGSGTERLSLYNSG